MNGITGFMTPQVTTAALVAENRLRATPASVDFDPDLREPGGPRLDVGTRRAAAAGDG